MLTLPYGISLDLSDPRITRRERLAIVLGRSEREELRLARRYVPSTIDVVELGASVGYLGAHLARGRRDDARYIGVELKPWLAQLAMRNTAAPVLNAAISYSGAPRVGIYEGSGIASGGAMRGSDVAAMTLSSVLDVCGINGAYALVTDIEGSECGIWAQDSEALRACQVIIAELHHCSPTVENPDGEPVAGQLARLSALGFRVREKGSGESTVYALTR